MSAIRVLIYDMPPMLHSMVAAMLQSEEGIILLEPENLGAEQGGGDSLADVVLVSASDPLIGCPSFGADNFKLPSGIVAIADDAREATIIHLSHSRWPLVDSRKDSIGAAIRIAAAHGAAN